MMKTTSHSKKSLPHLSFLTGSHSLKKKKYFEKIKNQLPSIDESFGIIKTDNKCQSLSQILQQAKNIPFLGGDQLFYVTIDKKLTAEDLEVIRNYLEEDVSFSYLLFDLTVQGSRLDSFKKNEKCFIYQSDDDQIDLKQEVIQKIKRHHKKIEGEALRLFLERSVNDPLEALQKIDQILLYVGERELIKKEDVMLLAPDIISFGAFDLANAISDKNMDRMLEIYREQLNKGVSPQEFLGSVHWQLRRIFDGKSMVMMGEDPQTIGKTLRIGNYFVPKFIQMLQGLSFGKIQASLRQLLELDNRLKTTSVDSQIEVEKFLVQIAV